MGTWVELPTKEVDLLEEDVDYLERELSIFNETYVIKFKHLGENLDRFQVWLGQVKMLDISKQLKNIGLSSFEELKSFNTSELAQIRYKDPREKGGAGESDRCYKQVLFTQEERKQFIQDIRA